MFFIVTINYELFRLQNTILKISANDLEDVETQDVFKDAEHITFICQWNK